MRSSVSRFFLLVSSLVALVGNTARGDGATVPDRQQYIESLPAAEKDELRRKQERFEKLSPEEQEKLRAMEQALVQDAEGQRLREVMLRYHEWLRALPPSQRTEIMIAPAEERIEKIKKRLDEQETQRQEFLRMQSIRPQDVEIIRNWMKSIFSRAEPELLKHVSPQQREDFKKLSDSRRFGFVVAAVVRKQRMENNPMQLDAIMGLTEEDRKGLVRQLSSGAQSAYDSAAAEADRRQLVLSWMRAAVMREIMWVSPQEVKRFADRPNPKLPDHLRDQIDYLPPNQVRAEFEGMFREESRRRYGDGPGSPRPHFRGSLPGPPPREKQ
jgi:hypothetical protein